MIRRSTQRSNAPSIFFFNDTATTEIYTLSLHDALPISAGAGWQQRHRRDGHPAGQGARRHGHRDRSEEHTSELQSRLHLVCRLLLEKKKTAPTAKTKHPLPGAKRTPTGATDAKGKTHAH